VDSKAVVGVGAQTRVPNLARAVVEKGKCRKNLVDFKPVARVGARTKVPEGGVIVTQLVLVVCLVCGWVFEL
jgi:hypothetical protein